MNIYKKLKWFSAVLGVFLIILATNLIDKKSFLKVEEAVENIYNERLLAKELLLGVSIQFHEKELAYALNDSVYLQSQNDVVNAKITELLQMFDKAEITRKEKIILADLNKNHSNLIRLEAGTQLKDTLYSSDCAEIFSSINTNIKELSDVQIKEGKNQKFHASDAVNTVKLFSKIETYLLIFLALFLVVIILYSPKKRPKESDEI
jgi:hypothetical protein